ncbi:uncharacterized protein LOC112141882 isoform X2 [Oryzias melastigma]|uniref:Ig-like domain-containing protein n=1 Tax=Oryzias melastigma TaxID=30732 RepID=A0A3B3C635_ORYME|nr:uncharacterized protein LOC112141882 isoform X2 [Oryzias melastigma]
MIKFSQVLFLLNAVWTLTRGDADVFCQLGQSCILPCSFQAGDEAVIHWIQQPELTKKQVHSFYHNKDQLDQQDARFKNRTSLFHDQISKGNASLRLTGVMLEDEGRYMCYSSILAGKEEFFVNLKVYAPVQDITIQYLENEIICSSDGIYPEPTLTWTPDQTNQKTRLTQTEQKLYSIRSSVPSADSMDVTCTVSTPAGRRRATLESTVHENILGTETSISCSNLTPFTMYIWRFNHSEEMVRGTPQGPHSPTEKWQQHIVESSLEKLTLKQLQPNLTGIYTCEVWSDQETFIKSFFLHVTEDNNMNTIGIIVGVVVGVAVLVLIAIIIWLIKKWVRTTFILQQLTCSHISI